MYVQKPLKQTADIIPLPAGALVPPCSRALPGEPLSEAMNRDQEAPQQSDTAEGGGIPGHGSPWLCAGCHRTFVDCPCLSGPMVSIDRADGTNELVSWSFLTRRRLHFALSGGDSTT
jgi:hypothetical protein